MIKLCECGCGQPTKIITHTCNKRGEIKGEYNRFVYGHAVRTKKIKAQLSKANTGTKNINWTGGKPKCIDCGKLLSTYRAKRCRNCFCIFFKGKNCSSYKHGLFIQKHYCKDCGKLLAKSSYRCVYCQRCTQLGNRSHSYKNGKPYCKECGKPLTNYKSTYCKSCRQLGDRCNFWKGGITPLSLAIRALSEYKQWHDNIFVRDNYTCQECGLHSGCGKAVYLEVHHSEKSFLEILQEFLQAYDQFSPFEDQHTLLRLATKWQPFWTAEGETLCKKCHNLTKKGNLSKQKGTNG